MTMTIPILKRMSSDSPERSSSCLLSSSSPSSTTNEPPKTSTSPSSESLSSPSSISSSTGSRYGRVSIIWSIINTCLIYVCCILIISNWSTLTDNVVAPPQAYALETTAIKPTKPKGIFNSLWDRFKETLESTTTALSSSPSRSSSSSSRQKHQTNSNNHDDEDSYSSINDNPTSSSSSAAASDTPPNRRTLMEYTLEGHYTNQLVDSSSYFDESHWQTVLSTQSQRQKKDNANLDHSSNTNAQSPSMTIRKSRDKAIRWQLDDTSTGIEGTAEMLPCLCFSDSPEAFWSFILCAGREIHQGLRQRDMTVKPLHTLGRYTPWETIASIGNKGTAGTSPELGRIDQLATQLGEMFPEAQDVHVYVGGDVCTSTTVQNVHQRFSVVVYHDMDSHDCSIIYGDDDDDDDEEEETPFIRQIQEPQPCIYILHVCYTHRQEQEQEQEQEELQRDDENDGTLTMEKDKSNVKPIENDDGGDNAEQHSITESDAKQINETMQIIYNTLHTYLYQTTSDIIKKKHRPDRATSMQIGLPPLPSSRIEQNLQLIKDMFTHAYDNYMYNAFPESDLKPISCKPAIFDLVKIPALTLIDSLDTLIIMGNYTEFARSVERLRWLNDEMKSKQGMKSLGDVGMFALNQNVSVFETNIRVLGGLLSAHQLANAFCHKQVLEQDVWKITRTNDNNNDGSGGSGVSSRSIKFGNDDTVISSTLNKNNCREREEEEEEVPKTTRSSNGQSNYECLSSDILECTEQNKDYLHQEGKGQCSNNLNIKNETLKYWEYDGYLLQLAQDIGDRLLPAFETKTGIPYGTVNLLSGIPKGETTIASLAGGGTLSLEMELLSRLTGNPQYGRAAKLSARALWMRRSRHNLLGKHICTNRGDWTESLSGIGSNSDSFYEYLIKHYILFPEDHDFWFQMVAAYAGVHKESRLGEWYGDVDVHRGLSTGGNARRVFEALMAFYPGMQVLLGEISPAARSLNSFFLVREYLGFLPERFNYAYWQVDTGGGRHYLRPELLESAYFLHRASKGFQQQFRRRGNSDDNHKNKNNNGIKNKNDDNSRQDPKNGLDSSGWQWAADFALHTIEKVTKTECGYASLYDLFPINTESLLHDSHSSSNGSNNNAGRQHHQLMDEMPSFFLSETLKYLYLTFDEDNIIHTDPNRDWVFTTEAHPIHHQQQQHTNSYYHNDDDDDGDVVAEEYKNDDVEEEDVMENKLKYQKSMIINRLRKKLQESDKNNVADNQDDVIEGRDNEDRNEKNDNLVKNAATTKTATANNNKDNNNSSNSNNFAKTALEGMKLNDEYWAEKSTVNDYVEEMEKFILRGGIVQPIQKKISNRLQKRHYDNHHRHNDYSKNDDIIDGYYYNLPLIESNLIEPYVDPDHRTRLTDFFQESEEGQNAAHVTFRKFGRHALISKSCPNFYVSSFLWVRALNGGVTDYADMYLSSGRDSVQPSDFHHHLLGSTEALALLGSGIHPSTLYRDKNKHCAISGLTSTNNNIPKGSSSSSSSSTAKKDRSKNSSKKSNGKDRVDMGDELGTFEVSAFPGGSGFFIEHMNSGETMISTLISDGVDDTEAFVMVYASTLITPELNDDENDDDDEDETNIESIDEVPPPDGSSSTTASSSASSSASAGSDQVNPEENGNESSKNKNDGRTTTTTRTTKTTTKSSSSSYDRTVAVADLHGDSFICNIEIFESWAISTDDYDDDVGEEDYDEVGELSNKETEHQDEEDDEERIERFLARFPCAPALFGPTHLSRLSESDGLIIEAVLRPPDVGQKYGCVDMASTKGTTATTRTTTPTTTTTASSSQNMPEVISQEKASDVDDTPSDPASEEYCSMDGLSYDDDDDDDVGDTVDEQNGVVQLVHRGICTFQEKALNQKETVNAQAVIMINSEAHELFVMSGGTDDNKDNPAIGYPATVLVTGSDGAEIQRIIEEEEAAAEEEQTGGKSNNVKKDTSQLMARISMTREEFQLVQIGNSFTVVGNNHWPALRIQNEVLQVFSKSGWGVHAVPHPTDDSTSTSGSGSSSSTNHGEGLEWQLYIMQHTPVENNHSIT